MLVKSYSTEQSTKRGRLTSDVDGYLTTGGPPFPREGSKGCFSLFFSNPKGTASQLLRFLIEEEDAPLMLMLTSKLMLMLINIFQVLSIRGLLDLVQDLLDIT